jgi:ribose transport system substrate-binding protein
VGFDASPELVKGLTQGEIDGLVVQNPTKMGYDGVKTLVEHLKGNQVPVRIDTGVKMVTRDNMNDPDIKPLLGVEK